MRTLLAAGLLLAAHDGTRAEETPAFVDSAEKVSPILVGSSVPDGPLRTQEGQETTLGELRGGRPAVLVFYRGHW
jgi:cytochrome oxidase Cu insertion factor (SCO1/SenC/PrrC family)